MRKHYKSSRCFLHKNIILCHQIVVKIANMTILNDFTCIINPSTDPEHFPSFYTTLLFYDYPSTTPLLQCCPNIFLNCSNCAAFVNNLLDLGALLWHLDENQGIMFT